MASKKVLIASAGILVYLAKKTILKDASLSTLARLWIAIVLVPVTLRFLYRITIYKIIGSPYASLPSPAEDKPHWFFGHFLMIRKSKPGMLTYKWLEENDTTSFIRLYGILNMERLMPVSHAALQTILQTESYKFKKSEITRKTLALILGDGIINAEGDSHKRQRKLLNPSFAFGHIKSLTPIFVGEAYKLANYISRLVDEEKSSENASAPELVLDVDVPIQATTLDIIFKAGFGTEFNALENRDDELVKAYRDVFGSPELTRSVLIETAFSLIFGLPGFLPTARNRQIARSKQVVQKFALTLIREMQEKQKIAKTFNSSVTAVDKNILSLLIEDGKGAWKENEILNNLMTSGHETTSTATSFALFHLSRNPEIQARLRKEISSIDLDRSSLTYEKIESLKYLNNFCREVLRFSPPVPITAREAIEDVMVDGVLVKKGTLLLVPIVGINRLKRYWGEDSGVFNPDRWDNLPTEAASPYSFITFLQGPRSCIGRKFAEIEFKALIIALISRFEFSERVPGEDHEVRTMITTKFINGLPLRIKRAI